MRPAHPRTFFWSPEYVRLYREGVINEFYDVERGWVCVDMGRGIEIYVQAPTVGKMRELLVDKPEAVIHTVDVLDTLVVDRYEMNTHVLFKKNRKLLEEWRLTLRRIVKSHQKDDPKDST